MAAVDDLIGAVDYGVALGDGCFFGQLLGCPWGVGLAEALTMALGGMVAWNTEGQTGT
jgi:hypothetical protein